MSFTSSSPSSLAASSTSSATDTPSSIGTSSSADAVDAVIARLDLVRFIRSWNNGAGSIIPSCDLLVVALGFKPARLASFDAALDEAVALGHATFEAELYARLEPIIFGSAMLAALAICERWAMDLVTAGPEGIDVPAPFSGEQAFIDWVLSQDETPADLCGPYGEEILDEGTVEVLLRRALGTVTAIAAARRSGWLEPSL